MNNVILIGRLVRDPEIRQTASGMCTARYTIAVDRQLSAEKRNQPDTQKADFISCTAFGKTAEFVQNYLTQGMKICVRGHIQTGSYTNKDGQKVYTTDVVVDQHEFVEKKQDSNGGGQPTQNPTARAQRPATRPAPAPAINYGAGDEEELPWS